MPKIEHDLISVVIPTRNRRDRLERAINSAKSQTWPNIQIIVVDDASTDGTQVFLQQLASADASIQVIRNDVSRGGGGARNQGIEAAKGVYVAFLDDDDIWMPEKLREQAALMKANPQASAVSCDFVVQHSPTNDRVTRIRPPMNGQQILRSNHLGGASMCFTTKAVLSAVHGFDPSLRSGQDWDLWIKLHGKGEILVCNIPLVCYMPHDDVRITSNLKSTYAGRRRIYLRYRTRMSEQTRRYHLCELVYCRKVLLSGHLASKCSGAVQILKLATGGDVLRYVYRYLKRVVTNT